MRLHSGAQQVVCACGGRLFQSAIDGFDHTTGRMVDQLLFGGSIGGIDVVEEAMCLAARMAASKLRVPNSSNTFERYAYQLPVVRYLQRALLRRLAYGSQLCVHDCIDGFGFSGFSPADCVEEPDERGRYRPIWNSFASVYCGEAVQLCCCVRRCTVVARARVDRHGQRRWATEHRLPADDSPGREEVNAVH
jgi:hypothetical protein